MESQETGPSDAHNCHVAGMVLFAGLHSEGVSPQQETMLSRDLILVPEIAKLGPG